MTELIGFCRAALDVAIETIGAGIIDPTKVTLTALQNVASIAGLMIKTECVIAGRPEGDWKTGGIPGDMRRTGNGARL